MVRPSNLVCNQHYKAASYIANVLDVVHSSDSGFGISFLAVTNETETTAATSITIFDDDLWEPDVSMKPK